MKREEENVLQVGAEIYSSATHDAAMARQLCPFMGVHSEAEIHL